MPGYDSAASMTSGSTRPTRAWSPFWACVAAMVAVGGACSGGSDGKSSSTSTTTSTSKPPASTPPTVTRPPVTVPPGRIVLVPRSVDPTGRLDVTKPMQRFLASVRSGHIIRFRKGGRYRVEGTLFLRRRQRMTIDGNGATVFATTRGDLDRAQWWITGGSRIVFRNL